MIREEGGNTLNTLNVETTEPSMGGTEQHDSDRKPGEDTVSALAQCSGPEHREKEKIIDNRDCEFKRGGMCLIHGCMGTKYVEKTRVWSQRKDGTFGWKPKSTTKYVCHFREVAKTNVCKGEENSRFDGVAKTNLLSDGMCLDTSMSKNTALGGLHSNTVDDEILTRVSGDDYRTAGSIESESEMRGSKNKDPD